MSKTSDRLKREANMLDIVRYLYGGDITKKGDAYFFRCPNPAHQDNHASAYTKDGWNNIICTSCGYYSQAVDLLQLEKGLEFGEACDLLYELEGRPSWYKDFSRRKKNSREKSNQPVLTGEELNFLDMRKWEAYLTKEEFKKIAFQKCKRLYLVYKKTGNMAKANFASKLATKIRSL